MEVRRTVSDGRAEVLGAEQRRHLRSVGWVDEGGGWGMGDGDGARKMCATWIQ